jgi:hypothetical protein
MKDLDLGLIGTIVTVATIALFFLSGTEIVLQQPESNPVPRNDTVIPSGLPSRDYTASIRYYTQDEVGITNSVDEIRATVSEFDAPQGENYYRWTDYEIRDFALADNDTPIENGMEFDLIASDDSATWQSYDQGIGFTYRLADTVADEHGQLGNMPDMGFLPRDMDGFQYYLHVLDFHMWEFYARMIYDESAGGPLVEIGDSVSISEEGHIIDMTDWGYITSDLEMGGGLIYIEYVGDSEFNGEPTRVFYFQQNQRLRHRICASVAGRLAFRMPISGTNRFSGFFELDSEDRLVRGHYNEYVYSRVMAPFFIKVLIHSKREYSVSREIP